MAGFFAAWAMGAITPNDSALGEIGREHLALRMKAVHGSTSSGGVRSSASLRIKGVFVILDLCGELPRPPQPYGQQGEGHGEAGTDQ